MKQTIESDNTRTAQTERVCEKEKLPIVTLWQDRRGDSSRFGVYFCSHSTGKKSIDQQEKSPGIRNLAKILPDEGKMVLIESTRGNDTKFHLEVEFEVQGKEAKMNKTKVVEVES